MAQVKMYSKKDKRLVNFPIACNPSGDEFDILPPLKRVGFLDTSV